MPAVRAQVGSIPLDAPNPIAKRGDGYYLAGQLAQVNEGKLWRPDGPSWKDVTQGAVGDCWLVAVAASIAHVDPEHIKSMMTDRPKKKKVDVTLYLSEGVTKVYTVKRPTPKSSASDNFGVTDGLPIRDGTAMWPAVLELAMMEFAKDNPSFGIPEDLNGGLTSLAYEAIYGYSAFADFVQGLSEERVVEMLTTGKPTAVGLLDKEGLGDAAKPEYDNQNLPTGHAYSIIYYDPATRLVTLRNPWASIGTEDTDGLVPQTEGQFELDLDNFLSTWYTISGV